MGILDNKVAIITGASSGIGRAAALLFAAEGAAVVLNARGPAALEAVALDIKARGGKVIALTNPGADLDVDHPWEVPAGWGPLSTFFMLPALQLFAYEMADYLGKDVDQPRNLAKSVTVE